MTATRTAIAKISVPRLFGVVARERLFAWLDRNLGRPLIWIEGPPGAGKTALVASYLDVRGLPVLWYQVDPGDADPANLFHYLAIAAAGLAADAPPLPRLAPEHLSDLAGFARTFFRELFPRLPAATVLVLDNFQEAPPDSAWHALVGAAAVEVPRDTSIVCVSRAGVPATFAQLAANGRLSSLQWDALELTLDETRAMAAARDIGDDWLVRALHEQSEGWAAGITLMLERLGRVDRVSRVLPADTREAVFDYFASLLFDQAPDEMQATLLSLAYMPHVTVSAAARVSGNGDAGRVLEDLYRRHLFTDRRPGPEPVYQFHAMFREFLQQRAAAARSAADVLHLKRLTADALEASGELEPAMALCKEVSDWDHLVRLMLGDAESLLASGRWQTLARWIECLPDGVLQGAPSLLYWLGICRSQVSPASGLDSLRSGVDASRRLGDAECCIRCQVASLTVGHLAYAGLASMDAWLDELLADVRTRDRRASHELDVSFWGALCAAMVYARPWHPWAPNAVRKLEESLEREVDPMVGLTAAQSGLIMAALTGQFERGDAIAERALHMVASPDASPPHAIWTLLQVGYLRFSEARYEEALDCVRRACGVADANGLRATFVHVFMFRFMIEFRVAGWDVANATLAEIERLPRPAGAMAQGLLHVYQARRAQFAGDCEEAANLAEMTHAAMLRTGSPYQEMIFGLIDGELWLNAGRVEKARQAIARSREIVERSPIFDCFLAAVVFCEAFLARAEGKGESCMERLTQALALAREGRRRYYLRYLECCMPPLFSLALEEGIEVEFVQQMIRMFRLPAPADAPDVWPRAVQIRTLGGFQVRVNGEALEFARKVPKKTLALLKALIAHGGEEVSEDWLCDALWGDEEADAARQALGITVVRLRKLLGKADAIRQHGGSTALDRRLCWVDAWRFEQLLRDDASTNATSRALALYGGTFLPEDEGESWTVATRERLRGRFVHALATTGLALEAAGRADDAIRLYLRGLDADPIVETFSQGLMRCLRALGRHSEAAGVFRRLRQTLSVVLGVSPSQESERLYRDILSDMAGAGPRLVDVSLSPEALHGATAAGIRQRRR